MTAFLTGAQTNIYIMNTRILLSENKEVADSVINQKQQSYKAGLFVLAGLAKFGLELEAVNNWEADVEPRFKTEFPNSTLNFNLSSRGIKDEFRSLETYYNANKYGILFEPLKNDEIEAIREQYRVYATEKQAAAHALAHSIANDLNKLKELGVPVNTFQSLGFCPVFVNNAGSLEVYQKSLLEFLTGIK